MMPAALNCHAETSLNAFAQSDKSSNRKIGRQSCCHTRALRATSKTVESDRDSIRARLPDVQRTCATQKLERQQLHYVRPRKQDVFTFLACCHVGKLDHG